ncbi:MAG TPA: DUF2231 domain-containing protein [Microthrixaceae bacterium]|nr:DUF2231 domain-containing protein [Microthrixaceae bacterium]
MDATNSSTPPVTSGLIQFLESEETLDRATTVLDQVAAALPPAIKKAFGDQWLGHPLHPVLTDLPIGCWTSAFVLDFIGGRSARPAARRLVALGVLTAVPTAVAGVVDYSGIDDTETRRVAAVHAMGNSVVLATYALSWRARRLGHHFRGMTWGIVGGALATGTAALGGHLAFGTSGGEVEPELPDDEPATDGLAQSSNGWPATAGPAGQPVVAGGDVFD